MRSIWKIQPLGALLLGLGGLAQGGVIHDGASTENLIKVSNMNGFGTSQTELTAELLDGNAALVAEMTGVPGDFSLRSAWYAVNPVPTNGTYAVSALFLPHAQEAERRGGVMGWLNLASKKGIALFVVPEGPTASFRVATVDFEADSGFGNESSSGLYTPNGVPAEAATGSSWTELGSYSTSQFALFELQFSPPSAADLLAVTNATARLKAQVYQGTDGSGNRFQVGASIELLTDLPLPETSHHRVGYYAYNGNIFGDPGRIGFLDELSGSGSFSKPNQPPTVALTSPTEGTTLTEPGILTLEAKASDSDGLIKRVEFYSGTRLITTADAPPYRIEVRALAAGVYSYSAKAVDDQGSVGSSAPVQVTVKPFVEPGGGGGEAVLSFAWAAGKLTISWAEKYKGQILQSSATLLNPVWKEIPGTSKNTTYAVSSDGGAFYYRLVKGPGDVEPGGGGGEAVLSFALAAGKLTISWADKYKGQVLQSSATLLNPVWKEIPGTSENTTYAVGSDGGAFYYRLVEGPGTPVDPSVPRLTVVLTASGVRIQWPSSSTGYRLETAESLMAPLWETVPSANNSSVLPAGSASRFFRLSKP